MIGWLEGLIAEWGAPGVALLMFLENLFPPIPSEAVMPMAGYVAARDGASLPAMILAGTAGSVAGAAFWYLVGTWFSTDRLKRLSRRYGRWMTVRPKDIERADRWFDRRGWLAVLLGRLAPAVRTLISVPAGMTGMRWGTFLICTALGSLAWTAALAFAGFWLGERSDEVADVLGPAGNAVLALLIAIYVWRVIRFRPD